MDGLFRRFLQMQTRYFGLRGAAVVGIALCTSLAAHPATAGVGDVDVSFQPGRTPEAAYEFSSDSTQLVEFANENIDSVESRTVLATRVRWRVVSDDGEDGASDGDGDGQRGENKSGNQAVIELVHEHVDVRIVGGATPGHFDSDAPAQSDGGNLFAAIFRPLIGQPLTLTLARDGEIVSVRGVEAITPPDDPGMLFDLVAGTDAIQSMYGPMFRVREVTSGETEGDSLSTVAVGEMWTLRTTRDADDGTPDTEYRFRLADVVEGKAQLAVTGRYVHRKKAADTPGIPQLFRVTSSSIKGMQCGMLPTACLLRSRRHLRFPLRVRAMLRGRC